MAEAGAPPDDSGTDIDSWDAVADLKKVIPQSQYARRSFDRGFYRNCLFYVGQQWIRYSRSAQQWRPIAVPDWFPKQITNKFAVAIDLMASVFMQSDPQSIYRPSSAEFKDIAAARAAEDISGVIDEEVDQSELEGRVAKWMVMTGNCFLEDGYDNDPKHGTKFVHDLACIDCIAHVDAADAQAGCPLCGGANLIPYTDEDGQPAGKDVPIGKMYSECVPPFEMHFDLVSENFEGSPYAYRARTYPVSVLEDMFPELKGKIKGDDCGIDSGLFYQTALAYITNGTSSSPGNYSGSVGSVDNTPRATLYKFWKRPTSKLPTGGFAYVIGDTCAWKGPLPYHDEKGAPLVTLTHFKFNNVAGRVFAKTPADDAVFKQVQRNKIEAFIQLAVERTSNPTWLLPKGIGIDNITGEPGEKMWYNPFLNVKPERVGGSEIPGSVFRWLEAVDFDIMDITHTREVMRGMAPENTPTFGAAQLILDRAFAGYQDGLKSWGKGWNQVRRYRLCIWREYASDERTKMVLGKNREWEAKKFSNADMEGSVSVHLEEGSISPKSKAYDQYIAAQMVQNQIIDLSDPMVRMQFFNLFDLPQMIEGLDIDVKDAQKEKDEFLKTGNVRPRPGIDNDPIHYADHTNVIKSDEYATWPLPKQMKWMQHALYHKQQIAQAQQAAAQNDPRAMNAKARLEQIQLEIEGLAKEKGIELQHLEAKKTVELQAHGAKKGLDLAVAAQQARQKMFQRPPMNGASS